MHLSDEDAADSLPSHVFSILSVILSYARSKCDVLTYHPHISEEKEKKESHFISTVSAKCDNVHEEVKSPTSSSEWNSPSDDVTSPIRIGSDNDFNLQLSEDEETLDLPKKVWLILRVIIFLSYIPI